MPAKRTAMFAVGLTSDSQGRVDASEVDTGKPAQRCIARVP